MSHSYMNYPSNNNAIVQAITPEDLTTGTPAAAIDSSLRNLADITAAIDSSLRNLADIKIQLDSKGNLPATYAIPFYPYTDKLSYSEICASTTDDGLYPNPSTLLITATQHAPIIPGSIQGVWSIDWNESFIDDNSGWIYPDGSYHGFQFSTSDSVSVSYVSLSIDGSFIDGDSNSVSVSISNAYAGTSGEINNDFGPCYWTINGNQLSVQINPLNGYTTGSLTIAWIITYTAELSHDFNFTDDGSGNLVFNSSDGTLSDSGMVLDYDTSFKLVGDQTNSIWTSQRAAIPVDYSTGVINMLVNNADGNLAQINYHNVYFTHYLGGTGLDYAGANYPTTPIVLTDGNDFFLWNGSTIKTISAS